MNNKNRRRTARWLLRWEITRRLFRGALLYRIGWDDRIEAAIKARMTMNTGFICRRRNEWKRSR